MKIVTAYNYDPSFIRGGGGITYVHNLITHMLNNGIEITLFGVELSEKRTFTHENFEFIPVQKGTDKWWKFLLNLRRTVNSVKIPDPDIIHTHSPLNMHPFLKTYPKTPKVCTLHGMPLDWVKINYSSLNRFISPVYKHIEKDIINEVDKITTAGPYTKMRLMKRYPDLNLNDKIISIPSGTDIDKFKPMNKEELKAELGINDFNEIIIFVGRIAEIKNIQLLLKSYSLIKNRLKKPVLIIVGRGEKDKNIKDFAKKLGLGDVIFTGDLSSDNVVKFMNCANVLALMSWFEASPTVVREAISCGIPVVTTNVGDVKNIITNPYLGEIVNSYDEKDYAEALINVINLTKESPDKVRDECRKLACENFSFEHVASEFVSIYKELYLK